MQTAGSYFSLGMYGKLISIPLILPGMDLIDLVNLCVTQHDIKWL